VTGVARVDLVNAGDVTWGEGILLAYHWLDDRGNPIVWDGIRTTLPLLEPGRRETIEVPVRAPIPPGPYRLAFDVVAEHRAWLSELGSPMLTKDVDVLPRVAEPHADLPSGVVPAPDWQERTRAAHADGYAVVAGAIDWQGGRLHRRPHALHHYRPGPGRIPGFTWPLLCPSVLPGIELEPLAPVGGLPAFAAPMDEPWVYDGRIVLRTGR
jgi:hypothetical protein